MPINAIELFPAYYFNQLDKTVAYPNFLIKWALIWAQKFSN